MIARLLARTECGMVSVVVLSRADRDPRRSQGSRLDGLTRTCNWSRRQIGGTLPVLSNRRKCRFLGAVSEWLKGPHWKCGVRVTVPRVRIPPAPIRIGCPGRTESSDRGPCRKLARRNDFRACSPSEVASRRSNEWRRHAPPHRKVEVDSNPSACIFEKLRSKTKTEGGRYARIAYYRKPLRSRRHGNGAHCSWNSARRSFLFAARSAYPSPSAALI